MKDFQITLSARKEICENTIAFWFETKGIDYKFDAGQYAHFTIIDPKFEDKKDNYRALSIASSPDINDAIMIAARKNSSIFTKNLSSLAIGSKIFISKPLGKLILHKDPSIPAVFIAGGIGITPVRSIIENIIQKNLPHKINLFYSNRKESQIAFLDDFKKWSYENKNFKFIPTIEDNDNKNWKYEYGPIDREMMKKYLIDFTNKIYYLIGHPLMVESVKRFLTKEKITEENIKTEKFK